MYNYYQQPQQNAVANTSLLNRQMPFPGLKGHPVASLDEVRATSIDFDGSTFYFPDLANKKIYTKTVQSDGTALLNMYELKPLPKDPLENDYVTRQEFEQTLSQITELLKQQMPQSAPAANQPSNFKEVF